jgi:hypothetical protein
MAALEREKDLLAKDSPAGLPAGTRKAMAQVE